MLLTTGFSNQLLKGEYRKYENDSKLDATATVNAKKQFMHAQKSIRQPNETRQIVSRCLELGVGEAVESVILQITFAHSHLYVHFNHPPKPKWQG